MYLQKIDIQGFKSFAEPTSLVFNKELTAIVGPNGSGKSNIADAIRWVLGEQSMKTLRGKKSDDIIFAGSDRKGRLGFAHVAIHLDNSNRQADIDYDELIIERTIKRTGESEYKLNGSKVRLTDIQLLLARARVGQKSYSVIGQGMIDNLLSLSAQERRDFFDEATGVRQYQIKKNQALLKLEHTEDNLNQAELVLQELEPRLRTLTRQVKRLERKEDLENKLLEEQTQYYGYLKTNLDSELSKLTNESKQQESEQLQLTKQQKEVQQQLDAYEQEQDREAQYSALQKNLFNIQQEYNALTRKKIVIEGQKDLKLIKSGGGESVALKQRHESLSAKINTTQHDLEELQNIHRQKSNAISSLQQQLKDTNASLHTIEKELSRGNKEINWENIERETLEIHTDHEELITHLDGISSTDELLDFKTKLTKFSTKLKKFFSSLNQKSKDDTKTLWEKFNQISKDRDSLTTELHEKETHHELGRHKEETLKNQIKEMKIEVEELEREMLNAGTVSEKTLSEDLKMIAEQLSEKESTMKEVRERIEDFNKHAEEKKQDLVKLQKQFRTLQYDLTIKNNALTTLKIEVAKFETRQEDLENEIKIEAPHITISNISHCNATETRDRIEALKKQLNIIGGIDTETIGEYQEVKEKHDFLEQQTTDLRKAQKSLVSLIDDLDKQISTQFEHSFKNINAMFAKFFKKLFSGGNAKLSLTMNKEAEAEKDESKDIDEDVEDENKTKSKKIGRSLDYSIDIQATPPGKKLSSVNVLSGGEKALTSISLICAIIANNPPPFVVLDEVDAALDEANSIRFAEIISELTHQTQFVTVTHNRATMHEAKILYGVTMGDDGISRLLSVNFDEADKLSA